MIVPNAPGINFTRAFGLTQNPVPLDPYRSAQFHDREKERLFRRAWLNVAHINELPQAGSYIVKDILAGDASIIVVRAADGVVRAFHDVCTHRGSKISPPGQASGDVRSLRCRFHNWNFDLTGELLYVPDEERFFGICKKDLHLLPVRCETWEGLVFINLQPEPDVSLAQFLGEYGLHMQGLQHKPGFPLHPQTQSISAHAVWNCNWKLAIGAFLEAYHVRSLHGKTISNQYASVKNPFGHPEGIGRWGLHSALNVFGNSDYAPDHVKRPVESYFSPTGYHGTRAQAEMDAAGLDHPAINITKSQYWAQDINLIFPNTFFYVRSYGSSIARWWPLSHDKVLWETTLFFTKAENIRQRMAQEFAVGRQREILLEDMLNLADQQKAISSSPLADMQLNDDEVMIRMLHDSVSRFMDADDIATVV